MFLFFLVINNCEACICKAVYIFTVLNSQLVYLDNIMGLCELYTCCTSGDIAVTRHSIAEVIVHIISKGLNTQNPKWQHSTCCVELKDMTSTIQLTCCSWHLILCILHKARSKKSQDLLVHMSVACG